MFLAILGISYKSAPISLREQFAMGSEEITQKLMKLRLSNLVTEAVILSTCNRTELYFIADSVTSVINWLRKQRIYTAKLQKQGYLLTRVDAARHIMKVASGLDSMVIGEKEIVTQLKQAYKLAIYAGSIGQYLGRLFQYTFATTKTVRTSTAIDVGVVSVAYMAVKLSQRVFADFSNKTVCLLGAGQTATLLLKYFIELGVQRVMIGNRNTASVLKLIKNIGSNIQLKAFELKELADYLPKADIIVSATASKSVVIGKTMLAQSLKKRHNGSMFIIDLAVPRDVEHTAVDLKGLYLYCIDDLYTIIKNHQDNRLRSLNQASSLINTAAKQFIEWMHAKNSLMTVAMLRNHSFKVRDEMLKMALRQLQMGKAPEEVLAKFARKLTNALLHTPTINVRKACFAKDQLLLDMAHKIFDLCE